VSNQYGASGVFYYQGTPTYNSVVLDGSTHGLSNIQFNPAREVPTAKENQARNESTNVYRRVA